MGRKIKEECGVFGILEQAGTDIAPDIFLGLTALQHRGQEACGIAVSETEGTVGNCSFRKDTKSCPPLYAVMQIWESRKKQSSI